MSHIYTLSQWSTPQIRCAKTLDSFKKSHLKCTSSDKPLTTGSLNIVSMLSTLGQDFILDLALHKLSIYYYYYYYTGEISNLILNKIIETSNSSFNYICYLAIMLVITIIIIFQNYFCCQQKLLKK